jgi:hypothetical protein
MLAAGHGGQVLLSADAHAALAASESGWQAKALGEYRFKGIGSPFSVFQSLARRTPADFPRCESTVCHPVAGSRLRPLGAGYELREEIGGGDFGIVYRAYQPSVGREVATRSSARNSSINHLSFGASRPRLVSSHSSSIRTSSPCTTIGAIPTAHTS